MLHIFKKPFLDMSNVSITQECYPNPRHILINRSCDIQDSPKKAEKLQTLLDEGHNVFFWTLIVERPIIWWKDAILMSVTAEAL